ncbi:MAG: hypothetical protein GC154_04965 [bacterium]|nr:hypothetical protein [bacterium]
MNRLFRAIGFAAFGFFSFSLVSFSGEVCPGCDVSKALRVQYNRALELSESEQRDALDYHLPFGVPRSATDATNEFLLCQKDYIIGYDGDLREPIWTAYRLTKADVENGVARKDCFREDPRLDPAQRSTCDDYDEPVFDRGHLAPSGDLRMSEEASINSTILSNITPQHDCFNRVIWQWLETYVREWALAKDEIFVISGCIYDKDGDGARDDDDAASRVKPLGRVAIPTHFYKIILHARTNGFIDVMVFLLPHLDRDMQTSAFPAYLARHVTSIDDIESRTGLDFLNGLHERKEAAVERFIASSLWPMVNRPRYFHPPCSENSDF